MIKSLCKTIGALLALFILWWFVLFMLSIPVKDFMDYMVNSIKEMDRGTASDEYICDVETQLNSCKRGDWIYVPVARIAEYCDASNLNGGIRLNQYVMPLFNGGVAPDKVLCVYRGKPREKR